MKTINSGKTLPKNVAKQVSAVAKKRANISEIVNKNKVPAYCSTIAPPRVNSEIWSFLNRNVKLQDILFQGIQRALRLGINPLIRMAKKIRKRDVDVKSLRCLTSDTLSILCSVIFELSYRKLVLKLHIEYKFHLLCT